ncbi:NAD(P)/FAD-dependent oxidoreductase [Niabella drilacis]|uniref:Geranylgeranyl reductase family n=1 Tax=Niabella drilacis (strain DSM 25811 / CCM 8410 / CCUG 62505 / LMG 26954 / E90) TaxID=1285928 RepID=A0A1G7B1T8_NIADE|nr:geranylgeranyl reductase family protein [Niabella drilacis]SDE20902.1 geranylgeranyl reductase family [Niabella drilacis]
MISTKVCIIGAGPGGATAALQLNKDGIDCIVIDKAVFPRDKVCGDGLSGKVLTCLKRIDPSVAERLKQAGFKLNSWGVSFIAPNRRVLEVGYRPDFNAEDSHHKEVPIGYVCKRMDFDHFLVEELKRCAHVTLYEGIAVTEYTLEADGYRVSDGKGFVVKADLLIIANGAHSAFTKKIAGIQMEPAHYIAGLRAYYKNVEGMHPENFIELHFLKSLLPGYFWIFPLPNGQANVGVGMLSETVSRKKVNLKKELLRIVKEDPVLKGRFKDAQLEGGIEGYGLPLGSKKRVLTGERYLLVGDAAFLIDPFTGEGIGNAMGSGRLAALQAVKAIQAGDFSAAGLAGYDKDIERVLGSELRLSTRIQKLVNYPRLFNLLINISARNKKVQELLSCMFYEVDLRKKLTKPSFYIGLLLNK